MGPFSFLHSYLSGGEDQALPSSKASSSLHSTKYLTALRKKTALLSKSARWGEIRGSTNSPNFWEKKLNPISAMSYESSVHVCISLLIRFAACFMEFYIWTSLAPIANVILSLYATHFNRAVFFLLYPGYIVSSAYVLPTAYARLRLPLNVQF